MRVWHGVAGLEAISFQDGRDGAWNGLLECEPPKSSALQWHQVPPLEDLLVLLGRLDVKDSGASAARPQVVIMSFDTKRAIMHPKAIVMLVHRA